MVSTAAAPKIIARMRAGVGHSASVGGRTMWTRNQVASGASLGVGHNERQAQAPRPVRDGLAPGGGAGLGLSLVVPWFSLRAAASASPPAGQQAGEPTGQPGNAPGTGHPNMSWRWWCSFLLIGAVAGLSSACSASTPTAPPTPASAAATPAPAASSATPAVVVSPTLQPTATPGSVTVLSDEIAQ